MKQALYLWCFQDMLTNTFRGVCLFSGPLGSAIASHRPANICQIFLGRLTLTFLVSLRLNLATHELHKKNTLPTYPSQLSMIDMSVIVGFGEISCEISCVARTSLNLFYLHVVFFPLVASEQSFCPVEKLLPILRCLL